jgi:hypothetical protein
VLNYLKSEEEREEEGGEEREEEGWRNLSSLSSPLAWIDDRPAEDWIPIGSFLSPNFLP